MVPKGTVSGVSREFQACRALTEGTVRRALRGGRLFRSFPGECFSPSASRRDEACPALAGSSCRVSQTHPPAGAGWGCRVWLGPGALVAGRAVGLRVAESRGRTKGSLSGEGDAPRRERKPAAGRLQATCCGRRPARPRGPARTVLSRGLGARPPRRWKGVAILARGGRLSRRCGRRRGSRSPCNYSLGRRSARSRGPSPAPET